MIRPRSWKALAAAALVGGLSCSLLLAKPGKVVTKQGQAFEGDVQDRRKEQGSVTVTTADRQKIEVKAANIDRVEYAEEPAPGDADAPTAPDGATPPAPAPEPGSIEADLRNRLAALPRNDVRNRVQLARAALQRREYGVARDCLEQALQIDPRHQEARDMLTTVDAQQRLDQRAQNPDAPRTPPGDRPPGGRAGAPGAGGPSPDLIPPLSPDDINRIRQREWTRNDKLVKVRFVGDVKRRYVAANRIPPADFNNMNGVEQAWQIVSKGDEEMRNEVRLVTDPLALSAYRTMIQRAILPTCASAACHGGPQGGKFQLHPRADHEGEAYANFLTLSTYAYTPKRPTAPGAAPGAGGAPAEGGAAAGGAGQGAGPQGAAPAGGARGGGAGGAGAQGAGPGGAPGAPGAAAGGGAGAARSGGALAAGRPQTFHVIDRDRPADSLLLQFALPPNLADHPHPNVPGFRPIFRVLKDPRYEQFLRWISNDLSPLQSNYGIDLGRGPAGQVTDVTGPAGQPNQPNQPPPAGGAGQPQPGQAQPGAGQRPPQGQGQGQQQNPGGAAQPRPPRGQ